eukprot:TRINITY_DN2071_c0_g1_i1.p1 TRINITY_DN2071_c0_g1~~TRINITY_DN2071_c0_g1_i1.p1  ORF type:complete len:163 (-),score=32.37 TRINITY_DN2071_c0_g1_i1:448-936(-)
MCSSRPVRTVPPCTVHIYIYLNAAERRHGDVIQYPASPIPMPLCPPLPATPTAQGGYIVIKGRPCKVANVSTSKTGKHGHAKANFTAIDIFTGKKLEDIVPTSHATSVPNVARVDYQLLDISDDGFLSLLTGECACSSGVEGGAQGGQQLSLIERSLSTPLL